MKEKFNEYLSIHETKYKESLISSSYSEENPELKRSSLNSDSNKEEKSLNLVEGHQAKGKPEYSSSTFS